MFPGGFRWLRIVFTTLIAVAFIATSAFMYITVKAKPLSLHDSRPSRASTLISQWFPESKRQDFSLSAMPEPYMIVNKNICASVERLDAVFLVSSAPSHLSSRMFIRETWGNSTLYRPDIVRVVFMLGTTNDRLLQSSLDQENSNYSDIVQGKFTDSYLNLIHKTVLGLRWASENCMHSKIVVKTDDDVFVNMYQFLDNVNGNYSLQSMSMFCYARAVGTSPIERSEGKWKIGFGYFKNLINFPFVHCNGFFVAMTPDLLPVLYENAKSTPIIRLDDVWLTGILPTVIGGISVWRLESLTYEATEALLCFNSTTKRCGLTAVTFSTETVDTNKMWDTCMNNYIKTSLLRTLH